MHNKEFKIAKGWAVFIYITAPLLIGLFLWVLVMPFIPNMKDDLNSNVYFFILLPISLAMIGLMTIGLLDTIKGKVIISSDTLSIRSTFINRDLKFEEIKGFRYDDKYIYVESNTGHKKRIKFSTYIGNLNDLVFWLETNFTDLNVLNVAKEKDEILTNIDYGRDKNERNLQLKQAKRTAKILNWVSGLIAFWTFFKPEPYKYAILSSIGVPIAALISIIYYKGLIRVDQKDGSAYPSVFYAILFSSCSLSIRAMFDFNIFDYSNIWIPSILLSLIIITLIIFSSKEFSLKKAKSYFPIACLMIFLGLFSFGTIVTLNCIYDNSTPKRFESIVLDKRISKGKNNTSYYLKLKAWASQSDNEEVSVDKGFYEQTKTGENVIINMKKGLLEVPWFIVSK